ncbi:MAG: archaellum biogenesis protein FlaJ (TadC family) [Candidatus Nanohaloarchaea archaeon]|jgi:archaellum biogenesis protein FlaJ (TadC family)
MIDFFQDEKLEAGWSIEDKILFISISLGIVLVGSGLLTYAALGPQLGGAILIFGLIMSVLPYSGYSFLKNRAIREIENQFPSFLNDLAESKRGGMTLLRALESARESDYGRLNNEIEKVHNQMTWGVPFPEVMERFSRRMSASSVVQQSLSIIIQSFQSGGNITATIESVAEDADQLREVIQEKDAQLKQQLVIMYVIFFLFIGITVGIYFLLGQLLGLGSPDAGALSGIGEVIGSGGNTDVNFCNGNIQTATPFCQTARIFGFVPSDIALTSQQAEDRSYGNMAYYKSLLFLMLIVQGMCTAAVAGQIKEGSPSGGVKHALIMLPLALVVYMVVVAPAGVS